MSRKMREMVGGCCVCSDESGWDENPLVYCDGQGCNVAVHQGEFYNVKILKFSIVLVKALHEQLKYKQQNALRRTKPA